MRLELRRLSFVSYVCSVLMMVALGVATVRAAEPFALFESGQVRPLALSPDGSRLFVINTPDNRLEIFDVGAGSLTLVASVPVGLEPVAVAARSNIEVWVVNHLSDSVSIVDLTTIGSARVVRTLLTGDEPRDIIFGGPSFDRAFVTTAHRGQNTPLHATIETELTTAGIGRADVWVFDATSLGTALGGTPETIITLFGDTPRALAVTGDGTTVYAAVFHSGNQSTVLSEGSIPDGGEGSGGLPEPNTNFEGRAQPETGLIVKFDGTAWRDELGRDWSSEVRFNLPDHDVFVIDATATPPSQVAGPSGFFTGVGTILFNMIVNPASGTVYVSNLESLNQVRFEGPGVYAAGFKPPGEPTTVRGHLAESRITVLDAGVTPRHLNKHIDYSTCCDPLPNLENDTSIGFPLGMAISTDGSTLYVAGFGSSEVGVYDTTELESDTFVPNPADQVAVSGGGPTAVVLDESRTQLYVLTRFDNAVSIVDATPGAESEIAHVFLHNPEPPSVVAGRPFLYDTAFTSGHGDSACASCHIFADFDSLAWDLGNPDATVVSNRGPFTVGPFGPPAFPRTFIDHEPLKGPMTTQSFRGIANHGSEHWRGDRSNGDVVPSAQPNDGSFDEQVAFKEFNPAIEGLVGRNQMLQDDEMQKFTDFALQVMYPPNPIRNLDNSRTAAQQAGQAFYFGAVSDTLKNCNGCHVLDPTGNAAFGVQFPGFFGTDGRFSFENETQHMKIPQLRNMYQKVGMFGMASVPFFNPGDNGHKGDQIRGFGFIHDGSVDSLFRFFAAGVFNQSGFNPGGIPVGAPGDATRRNLEAFALAYDSNLAPIVGQQITRTSANGATVDPRIDLLIQRADAGECDVVVKGQIAGVDRGAVYVGGGQFRTDLSTDPLLTAAAVRALADTLGQETTFMCVPPGSGSRIGTDRDGDGVLDGDEIAAGTDPANASDPPCTDAACIMCERVLVKEGVKFSKAKSKALAKCALKKLKGTLSLLTDCAAEPKTLTKIVKAESKLEAKVAKACGGGDKECGSSDDFDIARLRWTGFCPNLEQGTCNGPIAHCGDIGECLGCIHGAASEQVTELYFNALASSTPGTDVNKCQQTIGKEGQKFLAKKAKELQKCWDKRIKGQHGDTCPDAGAAAGSPAERAAVKIAKAESKLVAQVCRQCGGSDKRCDGNVDVPSGASFAGSAGGDDLTVAAIGFAASCPDVTVPGGPSCAAPVTTLVELVECVACVTEFKVDCLDRAQVRQFEVYPAECNF